MGPKNLHILTSNFINVGIEAQIVDTIYSGLTWLFMARGLWNPVFLPLYTEPNQLELRFLFILAFFFFFHWIMEKLITEKREERREEKEMNM